MAARLQAIEIEVQRRVPTLTAITTERYAYDQAGHVVSRHGPYPGQTWVRDEVRAGCFLSSSPRLLPIAVAEECVTGAAGSRPEFRQPLLAAGHEIRLMFMFNCADSRTGGVFHVGCISPVSPERVTCPDCPNGRGREG
jgi:hypothetical protein